MSGKDESASQPAEQPKADNKEKTDKLKEQQRRVAAMIAAGKAEIGKVVAVEAGGTALS